ncbi:basic proline-rich protein-like [Diceros bicornis minor]|uniref:basic proline-rich protein-like n=1 Tax=Diceros bicornis minor TaxID=77932 RepID=UPI0026ED6F85|nr:basic proline-rich protein-like [Diceros bicornis minor]
MQRRRVTWWPPRGCRGAAPDGAPGQARGPARRPAEGARGRRGGGAAAPGAWTPPGPPPARPSRRRRVTRQRLRSSRGWREDEGFQKRECKKPSVVFKWRLLCPPPGGAPAARGDPEGLRLSSSRCSPAWWSPAAPQLGQGPDSAREEREERSAPEARARRVRTVPTAGRPAPSARTQSTPLPSAPRPPRRAAGSRCWGRRGSPWASSRPPSEVAAAVRVAAALRLPLGAPGRATTSHTRIRAHTLAPCGVSRPRTPPLGGAQRPSPGSRGWRGACNAWVPAPVLRLCATTPAPFGARAWPPALPPLGPRGSRRLPGARRAGLGGGWGPRAPGREAARLRAGESLDVGNSLPARPAERRGRAAAGRGHPGSPCGGRLAPRAACRAAPAGQGAPSRLGSLPSAAIRPPLPRPLALLPRGAARGSPQSCRLGTLRAAGAPARAGGRVQSPAAARRSRRESGRERGSRGGVCARVCESERERGSEGAGARECACLTRGEVCKGRIPSFLPQPLVETRRMQRPPGRSAAPRRAEPQAAAGPGSRSRGAPAPAHRIAPLPRRAGPASPSHGRPSPRKPPGGGAPPSSNPRSARRERPQEGDRLPPSLAAPRKAPV